MERGRVPMAQSADAMLVSAGHGSVAYRKFPGIRVDSNNFQA